MFLRHSTGRKILVTGLAAVGFAGLYEVTFLDSRFAPRQAAEELTGSPVAGARLRFTATGYCRGTTTASGVNVRSGIAAADPDLLPVGSVVQVENLPERYNGVYTVMDTGPKVHGRQLDIYIWNCDEAVAFGRRQMVINVLRMGWNPRNSRPGLVERLFRQREAVLPPPPEFPATSSKRESEGAVPAPPSNAAEGRAPTTGSGDFGGATPPAAGAPEPGQAVGVH